MRVSGATVTDVVVRVADMSGMVAQTAPELMAAITRSKRRLVIVVDELGESLQPKEIGWLLADLSDSADARVLIGCRDYLLNDLPDRDPMRLDQPPYLLREDVTEYVAALLSTVFSPETTAELADIANEVTNAADGNFLIAQLTARAVIAGGAVIQPFPDTVRGGLERLLEALPNPQTARDLLLPLAYATGDGLPTDGDLWLTASTVLRRPYNQADLDDLLHSPVGSFLTAQLNRPGGPRYRLFHQALADTLTANRDVMADQQRIWEAWKEKIPQHAEQRDWVAAPSYLLQHASAHAAAAGRLEELVGDISYLLHSDLTRLMPLLPIQPEPASAAMVAVLRLTGNAAAGLAATGRARFLALGAAHLGLSTLQTDFAEALDNRFLPLWAHAMGTPHQRLTGHAGPVNGVAGDHELVVSGGDDGTVRLWDAASGRAYKDPLFGHAGPVNAVAGDHELVVSGGDDGTVRLWNAATGHSVGDPLTGHAGPVWAVALGQIGDSQAVVSGGNDGGVRNPV